MITNSIYIHQNAFIIRKFNQYRGYRMGIKPTYIKAIGNELLEKHASHFTNEFEQNKLAVTNTTSITSKRVRNRVAGFVTRKINTKKVQ